MKTKIKLGDYVEDTIKGKMKNKHERLSNVDEARLIKVIEIKSIVGEGTKESPIRQIVEYFTLDGERIARTNYLSKVQNIHAWKEK